MKNHTKHTHLQRPHALSKGNVLPLEDVRAPLPSELFETRFTPEDVCALARDIGRPLPAGLKERIMAKVYERARQLSRKFLKA